MIWFPAHPGSGQIKQKLDSHPSRQVEWNTMEPQLKDHFWDESKVVLLVID
jgi:hypothetical protein